MDVEPARDPLSANRPRRLRIDELLRALFVCAAIDMALLIGFGATVIAVLEPIWHWLV